VVAPTGTAAKVASVFPGAGVPEQPEQGPTPTYATEVVRQLNADAHAEFPLQWQKYVPATVEVQVRGPTPEAITGPETDPCLTVMKSVAILDETRYAVPATTELRVEYSPP
jgi:hypothetical protein